MLQMPVFSHYLPLLPGLLIIAGLASCGETPPDDTSLKSTVDTVRQHIDDAVEEGVGAISPARAEVLAKLKIQLQSIDQKLEQLATRDRDLTEEARVEWNKKVDQLGVRRDAARRRLMDLSKAGEAGWSDLRESADGRVAGS